MRHLPNVRLFRPLLVTGLVTLAAACASATPPATDAAVAEGLHAVEAVPAADALRLLAKAQDRARAGSWRESLLAGDEEEPSVQVHHAGQYLSVRFAGTKIPGGDAVTLGDRNRPLWIVHALGRPLTKPAWVACVDDPGNQDRTCADIVERPGDMVFGVPALALMRAMMWVTRPPGDAAGTLAMTAYHARYAIGRRPSPVGEVTCVVATSDHGDRLWPSGATAVACVHPVFGVLTAEPFDPTRVLRVVAVSGDPDPATFAIPDLQAAPTLRSDQVPVPSKPA